MVNYVLQYKECDRRNVKENVRTSDYDVQREGASNLQTIVDGFWKEKDGERDGVLTLTFVDIHIYSKQISFFPLYIKSYVFYACIINAL